MEGINVLVREHENIIRLTTTIRVLLVRALEKDRLLKGTVETIIEFIRLYADKHHHGKEEEILFRYMLEDLGPVAEKIVRQGMLAEHDQARHLVMELDEANKAWQKDDTTENFLDVVGLLYGYARLLEAHAQRENAVVYPFAERNLSKARWESINEETRIFEESNKDMRDTQLKVLEHLESLVK